MRNAKLLTFVYFISVPIGFFISDIVQMKIYSTDSMPDDICLYLSGRGLLLGLFLLFMISLNDYVAKVWKSGDVIILLITLLNLFTSLLPAFGIF